MLAAAGAAADLGDRLVRRLWQGGRGGGLFGDRPGSVVLALLLLAGTGVTTYLALEAGANPEPRPMTAAEIHATTDIGSRTYVTATGTLEFAYVETYLDENDNGTQDAGENGTEWIFFLVDPATGRGVAVQTDRGPNELYRFAAAGTLVEDPDFIAPDLVSGATVIEEANVFVHPDVYIDATGVQPVDAPALAFGAPIREGGEASVEGVAIGSYSWCSSDPDGTGLCTEELVDRWDVIVYDPLTLNAIVVNVDVEPTFDGVSFTGMLRSDPGLVREAVTTPGLAIDDLAIDLSDTLVLLDGESPLASAVPVEVAAGVAALLAVVGVMLLVGAFGGYVRFRPQGDVRSTARQALAVGEGIPVRITGRLLSGTGYRHVRNVEATLRRVALGGGDSVSAGDAAGVQGATEAPEATAPLEAPREVAWSGTAAWSSSGPGSSSSSSSSVVAAPADVAASADAPGAPAPAPAPAPATTLIVERGGHGEGIAVGAGEAQSLAVGAAVTARASRPGIRLVAGSGPLILAFERDADRDRAASELIAESGFARSSDGTASAFLGTSGSGSDR